MRYIVPAVLVGLVMLWWLRLRPVDLADTEEPWRDPYTDRLEDVWLVLYEAQR